MLHFNEGKFKILVIADIQDDVTASPYTTEFIATAIDSEKPDLIVLNGDNIQGSAPSLLLSKSAVKRSIDQFLAPIVERGIPFAVVFGNHDAETIMSKEEQMEYYLSFDNCLARPNAIGRSVGNYNLLIKGQQDEPSLNLWFFDSNNRIYSEYGYGYAYVTNEQIEWYERTAKETQNSNGGAVVPAFVFQHIPVPEIYDLLTEVPKSTNGAVRGHGKWKNQFFVINPELVESGSMGEGPCPPDFNNGQFDSWLKQGDVVAAFFGHDHVNDFAGNLKGIDLAYTPGAGFYSYGNGYKRGVRVIEIDQNNPSKYVSRLIYYSDLIDEPIPDSLLHNGETRLLILQWVLILIVLLALLSVAAFFLVRKMI